MLRIFESKSFKKDLKKYAFKSNVLKELEIVLEILAAGKPIPAKYKNHYLHGKFGMYTRVQELHLKPDDLLVYFTIENESITLLAIGSHADLF